MGILIIIILFTTLLLRQTDTGNEFQQIQTFFVNPISRNRAGLGDLNADDLCDRIITERKI